MCFSANLDTVRFQQTQKKNIFITFVQCWNKNNVENVGPTLYKCYKNVFCAGLLGMIGKQCVHNSIDISYLLRSEVEKYPTPWLR